VGRIIRKLSIDELPQLFNVFKGDMSLVGPRPPVPQEVNQYKFDHLRRLDAVPGLTGLQQVSGRSDLPFERWVELDLQYIAQQSLRKDIEILLKTIPAVLLGKGAYCGRGGKEKERCSANSALSLFLTRIQYTLQ
jgi:lipopolysaccharide/colanic/teichoic acid biosynthesis glycosyltransferase